MRITCQRIGLSPISTSALGIACVRSWRRVPRPPQRITTGPTPSTAGRVWIAEGRRTGGLRLAARDGGQDRHLVAVGELRLQAVLEADVLTRDVHVHEPAQSAILGDPLAKLGVLVEDGVERLTDGGPLDLDLALALGNPAKLRRDLDCDRHRPGTLVSRVRP